MAGTETEELSFTELLLDGATNFGDNVAVTMADGKVVIIIDPTENQGPSSTGRNFTIASTRGNVTVDKTTNCRVTLTAYRPAATADERQELADFRKSLEA